MTATGTEGRGRWWLLIVACLGLLVGANATAINVALPSIKLDLRFSDASIVWVINAYLVTSGGFLLLSGRLGDLFGHRRMFLLGILLFALASIGCGLATSPGSFVAARGVQGVGGAIILAVTLSLIMNLFTEVAKRARALGISAVVGASAGSLGLLFGGSVTSVLSWRWIFFANAVIGAGIYVLCFVMLPSSGRAHAGDRLDVAGAVTATGSLTLAIYAIAHGSHSDGGAAQMLTLLAGAGVLLILFVFVETRAQVPLIPLGLFRLRNVAVANCVGVLWAAALLGWSFICTQYLQLILQVNPLGVGWAFLPATVISAAVSFGGSSALITRFGLKRPLVAGLLIGGSGLAFLARMPLNGSVMLDVLPGMVLVGLGSGVALNPLMIGALSGVPARDYGAASGILSTSFAMGGALGLSVLSSMAAAWTDSLFISGADASSALNDGYRVALGTAAVLALVAAVGSALLMRAGEEPSHQILVQHDGH